MFFQRSPRRLLLRYYGRVNIKVMADEISVNPRGLVGVLGEYIHILSEKIN